MWLLSGIFRKAKSSSLPEPEIPPPPLPPPVPEHRFGGNFPLPELDAEENKQVFWRQCLDHYRAETEYEKMKIDRFKALVEDRKATIEGQKTSHQWHVESSKAAFDYAKLAIGYALLMNGGAAVSVLSYLSTLNRNTQTFVELISLGLPLKLLAGGVVSAATCAASSYISQIHFTRSLDRAGVWWRRFALGCWIASIICFVTSIWLISSILTV